jgi:N-acetylglucosamine kinase-like BadF-type ATPase
VMSDSGEELVREAGRAALVTPGEEAVALAAIQDLVSRAVEAAGASGAPKALVAGLAGVGRKETRDRFEALLAGTGVAGSVRVCTDVEVGFHDAFGSGPGILLVGGTGSVALARTPGGRSLRSGGWGAVAGDEGSGFWLGISGLRAVFQAVDGRGPGTSLVESIGGHFGTNDPGSLMDRLWTAEKGQIAALAPRVVGAADDGDMVARGIVQRAVRDLAAHLVPLIREWREDAGLGGDPAAEIPVALVGGLVVPGGPLRTRLAPRIRALGGVPREAPPDPARGAARLALEV